MLSSGMLAIPRSARNDQISSMTQLPGELNSLDLSEAARRVAEREVSPMELTGACLERIAALDAQVNCVHHGHGG